MAADLVSATSAARRALVRERQRELYGDSLRTIVWELTEAYRITQALLADTIGISRPMLSQLVTGQRIKMGDPVAHARLMVLEHRRGQVRRMTERCDIDAVLVDVARVRHPWPFHTSSGHDAGVAVSDVLVRDVASAGELEAAAALLDAGFPAVADVLRRAAGEPRNSRCVRLSTSTC